MQCVTYDISWLTQSSCSISFMSPHCTIINIFDGEFYYFVSSRFSWPSYNDGHDGFLKSCGYLNMSLAHEYICVYICTRIFCNNAHAENINIIFEQWRKCILYLKKRNDNMLGYLQNYLLIHEAFIVCEPGYGKMWMCNCQHT